MPARTTCSWTSTSGPVSVAYRSRISSTRRSTGSGALRSSSLATLNVVASRQLDRAQPAGVAARLERGSKSLRMCYPLSAASQRKGRPRTTSLRMCRPRPFPAHLPPSLPLSLSLPRPPSLCPSLPLSAPPSVVARPLSVLRPLLPLCRLSLSLLSARNLLRCFVQWTIPPGSLSTSACATPLRTCCSASAVSRSTAAAAAYGRNAAKSPVRLTSPSTSILADLSAASARTQSRRNGADWGGGDEGKAGLEVELVERKRESGGSWKVGGRREQERRGREGRKQGR